MASDKLLRFVEVSLQRNIQECFWLAVVGEDASLANTVLAACSLIDNVVKTLTSCSVAVDDVQLSLGGGNLVVASDRMTPGLWNITSGWERGLDEMFPTFDSKEVSTVDAIRLLRRIALRN